MNRYNVVHCTVFDKKTGSLTEYNLKYNVIRKVRFPWKKSEEPIWLINLYDQIGQLVVSVNSNMEWERHDPTPFGPIHIERSNGNDEYFKYYNNGKLMYHKFKKDEKEYVKFYEVSGKLIGNYIENEEE